MSMTNEALQRHLQDPAIFCCRRHKGLVISAADLEDPSLFEDMEDGLFTGHAPNYVKVYVPGEGLHNQVRRVRITGLYKDGLTGSLEP